VGEYAHAEYDRGPGGPAGPIQDPKPTSSGYFDEASYSYVGAADLVLRWDDFRPTQGYSRFLVAGLNIYPGFFAKIGFQYAWGIDGTTLGFGPSLGNVGTPLADQQFMIDLQVSF
jgi:hypothetical protein